METCLFYPREFSGQLRWVNVLISCLLHLLSFYRQGSVKEEGRVQPDVRIQLALLTIGHDHNDRLG